MNIYLDVNGVLLQQNLTPAIGVTDFLRRAFEKGDVYWLTTHCKGDNDPVVSYLKLILPTEAFELIERVKPTTFDVLKTDGIDFSKDFLWFDDNIFESEKKVLDAHNSGHKHVMVDLDENPRQLDEFMFI